MARSSSAERPAGCDTARIYNFAAGPAVLPAPVLAQAQAALLDFEKTGSSILELPFAGEPFRALVARAEADLRELLNVPDDYCILFLQGGASAQFSLIPMNLLGARSSADYADTGYWSRKAMTEASRYCQVRIAASSAATDYDRVPAGPDWQLSPDAAYCHITGNETANGIEYHWLPEVEEAPLVADLTSNFLSRPIEVGRYGLIYAGAQKNVGPAGLAIVIVRRDLLGRAMPLTPAVFNYAIQADTGSLFNTPPTFALYVAGLVFRWIKAAGGVDAMEAASLRKSARIYQAIDASDGFYRCPVLAAHRSRMNACFTLATPSLTEAFLEQARSRGLVHLKGHSLVGGVRASLYNAMPEEGAQALALFMAEFAARFG